MRGHVDAETLAAFREGLLRRRRAGRVGMHLAACPRCADTDARLASVTTLLAAAPVPPMPAGLAARIEAALAAEAAQASHAAPGRPGTAGRGRSWLALRAAAVTAAVAIIAGGGYGVSRLIGQNTPAASGISAGGPAARQAAPSSKAAPGLQRLSPGTPGPGLPVVESGTRYQPSRLGSQARAVLARFGQPGLPSAGPAAGRRAGAFSGFINLPACVRRVSGGRSPRLVDLASYRGRRAAVIMVRAAPGLVRVWVVGTGCSATASDVLARTTVGG